MLTNSRFLCLAIFSCTIVSLLQGCTLQTVTNSQGLGSASTSASTAANLSTGLIASHGQPNIVILFADDLGYGDLGSYGHPANRTPNLDSLAAAGQRWTDFYVAAAVCSPSRGALLTGRLPNRTGLYGKQISVLFPNDTAGMPVTEVTMAEALSAVGYRTAIIGKWHLGEQPDVYPTRHGFDYWYGVPYSNDMDWVGEMTLEQIITARAAGDDNRVQQSMASRQGKYLQPKNEYWNVPVIRSRKNLTKQVAEYTDEVVARPAPQAQLTRRYTEESIEFINASAQAKQPFLLYLPYSMPHTPIFRSDAFKGVSLGGRYGDVIEEIDASVGAINTALVANGIAHNTLLVFTSDNGPWLTMLHHGGSAGLLKQGKGTTFEGGQRVPAIFSWPGHIEPGVVSDIGSAMDLYTTALSLAGASRPDAIIDGVDLSAVLTGESHSPRDSIAYYRSGELRAYRKGFYKLHLITQGAYSQPPARTEHAQPLLFHLGQDPAERFDIAAQYPEIVQSILQEIENHQTGLTSQAPIFDQRLGL